MLNFRKMTVRNFLFLFFLFLVLIISLFFLNIIYNPLISTILFSLFFIITFIYLAKKNYIYAFYYFFLFFYTIGTQIAYLYYPTKLALINGKQYFGLSAYFPYLFFVFLSFILIFLFFFFFIKIESKRDFFRIDSYRKKIGFLFPLIIILHNLIMIYFLSSSYSVLSYHTATSVLKANKIFFYGFFFYQITLLALYVKITKFSKNLRERLFYSILSIISFLVFIIITIKAGQKIEIASFFLGFLSYNLISYKEKLLKNKRIILALISLFILIGLFFVVIDNLRYSELDVKEFFKIALGSPDEFVKVLFNPENILFFDYTGPSLLLLTSIHEHIVIPLEVLKSNFYNTLIFQGYPILGYTLSRIIDPYGKINYGYYFLSEGYNFAGWLGILYNGIIFTFGLFIWNKFRKSNNLIFNNFMTAIIAMHVFDIIRAQSSFFVKGIYISFIPAIIIYLIISNSKIKIGKK